MYVCVHVCVVCLCMCVPMLFIFSLLMKLTTLTLLRLNSPFVGRRILNPLVASFLLIECNVGPP